MTIPIQWAQASVAIGKGLGICMSNLRSRIVIFVFLWLFVATSSLLAGCQGIERLRPLAVGAELLGAAYLIPVSVSTTEQAPVSGTPAITVTTVTTVTTSAGAPADSIVMPTEGDAASYAANRPITLTIPAIGLDAPVVPMGWEVALIDNKVTTRWTVPLDAVGWEVNSAGAGDAGNVILVGHQALGSGLLRPLALGEIEIGQEILVMVADGTTHIYQVSEETPPITAIGATVEETAQAAAYLAPGDTAKLTLVTGWPADTTTHRVFVVADYVGTQP
jgi:sortase (surface protein transpeptidase)